MPTPKPQPSRALSVIPSPLNNIPNPALLIGSGIALQLVQGNQIICDESIDFIAVGLKAGDIFYVPGAGAGTVTSVISSTSFTFNIPHDPMADPQTLNLPYIIYNGEDDNKGCSLYVGTGGSLETITAGGDAASYQNVSNGQIIPVQTIAVTGGSASNIVALW